MSDAKLDEAPKELLEAYGAVIEPPEAADSTGASNDAESSDCHAEDEDEDEATEYIELPNV